MSFPAPTTSNSRFHSAPVNGTRLWIISEKWKTSEDFNQRKKSSPAHGNTIEANGLRSRPHERLSASRKESKPPGKIQ
jgi:hypothetical protein